MVDEKKGKFRKLVIFAVAMGLCLTAIQISAISTTSLHMLKDAEMPKLVEHPLSKELTKNKITPSSNNLVTMGVDVSIMTSEYDIQNPSITTDGTNIIVLGEESQNLLAADITMIFSTDGGSTWGNMYYWPWEESIETKPVIDYCGNNEFQAYGSCYPDPMEGRFHLLHFPSMTDPEAVWGEDEGWTPWGFDITGYYEDFDGIDVCGYPHGENAPYPDFHGIITSTCIDSDTGLDTVSLVYETEDSGLQLLYFPEMESKTSHATCDIDLSAGYFVFACENTDDPDPDYDDGVWGQYCYLEPGNPDWWSENEWTSFYVEGGFKPDVAADGGNCYLVYEILDPTYGFSDIMCAHIHGYDGGLEISSVTQTSVEEEHNPSVTAIGQTVICTYTRNGNLFTSTSEDGGVTWEESEQINDVSESVVEQSYCSDVAMTNVVWTDNRAGTNSIYFDTSGISAPIISVESVSGGFGVSAVIKNTGTADATDVHWSIDLDGSVFIGAHKEGTISSLAAENSETVKTGFVFGLGKATITVTAGGATETAEGTVLGPFVIGL